MTMSNKDMMNKVTGALKKITTDDLDDSILAREKRDEFVRTVSESTPLLDDARQIDMKSHTHDIDRVGFGSRIMQAAKEGEKPDSDDDPDFHTNTLKSVRAIAAPAITDSSLEDNIEEEDFEDTLLDMIADRSGVDLEELFVRGDEDDGDNDYLKLTDGWLKKAENKIDKNDYSKGDVQDFFNKMIRTVPKKYLRDRSEWRIYCHWDIEDAYRDELRERGTGLGDKAQTEDGSVAFKGIKVKECPSMPEGTALLVPKENLVYGIYREIKVEEERYARKELTYFVTSMRVDCHYEDENAAVVGEDFDIEDVEEESD